MQINRLFEIVYILLSKQSTTAKDLAEHFEVSTRTIYRDIDVLSAAGIPIYASQGKGGGIALLEDYVLNKSVLSEIEQNEILFALQSLSAAKNPGTDRVLSKLSSLFNKEKAHWIEVDLTPWGSNKDQDQTFILLKDAVLNQRVIQFEYIRSSGEKSQRRVQPLKLLFKVRAWYLQSFCLTKNAYRTYKISRMANIQVTQDTFTERTAQDFPAPIRENSSQTWIQVRLKFTPAGAYRIFDEFAEKEIIQNQDHSFTVQTTLPESDWLVSYLLSFGADVTVLEPPALREKIQNTLLETLSQYKQ